MISTTWLISVIILMGIINFILYYQGASLFVNIPPNQSFSLILATDAKFPNVTNRDA